LKKLVLFLLAVISFLFITTYPGCVPSRSMDEVEVLPIERLVKKLEANRRRIKSFQGSGKISISSAQFNNSAQFQVVLQKPDSLYFSVMGPFGIELAQVLVTKDDFLFYEALHNTLYKGKVSDDVLKGIFKIDLSFQDLMNAFIGSVSLADHLYENPTKFEVLYDNYVMTYADSTADVNSVYKIDVRDLGIINFDVTNHRGQASLSAAYSKFKVFESVPIPYNIEVKNLKNKQTINIEYKNIEVNKRNTSIKMDIPEDATVIKW
jgi:outer membrane lipoprotein-sorting protein